MEKISFKDNNFPLHFQLKDTHWLLLLTSLYKRKHKALYITVVR